MKSGRLAGWQLLGDGGGELEALGSIPVPTVADNKRLSVPLM